MSTSTVVSTPRWRRPRPATRLQWLPGTGQLSGRLPLTELGAQGEVLVSDNGSTDGSQETARGRGRGSCTRRCAGTAAR
jgi:hypothetical protein